jgi:porin
LCDRHSVNFRVNDPPLVLTEAQLLWNAKKGDPGLDGKFKLGGWRHFGDFADERLSASGISLAVPRACQSRRRSWCVLGSRAKALPRRKGR